MDSKVLQRAAAIVDDYVVKNRAWVKGAYRVQFDQRVGAELVFTVVHPDDEKGLNPGGGKSFIVHVDAEGKRVLKVLGLQ